MSDNYSALVLALPLALLLSACAPSTYILKTPRVFNACSMYGDNPRQESFDALFETLSHKRGWALGTVDRKTFRIQARVFRNSNFVPLQFSVNSAAEIEIIRDPAQPQGISAGEARNLNRWLGLLEGNYTRRRCD